MATTTNYSWTTPDDTDLVKDGAAAIRTLGSAIDTTVFNNASAAIAKALIDAEGDLIVGDAADAVQRLAIGTTGQVLTVDTAIDGKIKWAAVAAAGFVGAYAYRTTDLTVSTGTTTAVDYDAEKFDTDSFHSTVTNKTRLTIPAGKGGKYLIFAKVRWYNSASGARYGQFQVNAGTNYNALRAIGQLAGDATVFTYFDVFDLSAGDYVEHLVTQGTGGNLALEGGITGSGFGCIFLGA